MNQNNNHLTHQVAVNAYLLDGDRFLLLKRREFPQIWAPPGGRLQRNEDPVNGLIREVKEETQLDIQVITPVNTWFGRWRESRILSIDYLTRLVSGTVKLSNEHSHFEWVNLQQLRSGKPLRLQSRVGFKVEDFAAAYRLNQLLLP